MTTHEVLLLARELCCRNCQELENGCQCEWKCLLCLGQSVFSVWALVKMPSASFTASRSYVRRSRRKGANRIPTPSRTTSGKWTDYVELLGLVLNVDPDSRTAFYALLFVSFKSFSDEIYPWVTKTRILYLISPTLDNLSND